MEDFNLSLQTYVQGLSDAAFDGSQFTWTNGQVCQRLERDVTNAARSNASNLAHLLYLSDGQIRTSSSSHQLHQRGNSSEKGSFYGS